MTPASSRSRARAWLGQVHLWLGLVLCLPLVVLGLSGSVLVFEDDLQHLLQPSTPLSPGEARPIAEILAAARAAAGADLAPVFYAAPERSGEPASVRLASAARGGGPGANSIRVWVDPASLQILARDDGGGLLRMLSRLHSTLLLPDGALGRHLVGWLGVVMLALGITGLVNWWPRPKRWRAAFTVRRGARDVLLHRDLHGAVGIWGILVFLVVSFSGVYLAFPDAVRAPLMAAASARDPRAAGNVRLQPLAGAEPMTVDAAVALAARDAGGARLSLVFLPSRPEQPYRIAFAEADAPRSAPSRLVMVDPWTRSIVSAIEPRRFSAAETALAWQRALHAGQGLGLAWKLLVAATGLLPLVFAVTGMSFWWLQRRAARSYRSPSSNSAYSTGRVER
jgi:uncharacterized iron-regulated membrane protein